MSTKLRDKGVRESETVARANRFRSGVMTVVQLLERIYASTTRWEPAAVAAAASIFALVFTYPVLFHFTQFGAFHDWDFATELQWVPFHTIRHFHQLPLWNPYKCGGMAMFANPQARILTPFFLLDLLFGPAIAGHLEIILHLAIACSGGYVLARVIGLGMLGGAVCGSLFAGSSWFYLHTAEGHVVFLAAAYLPWIAALFWIGEEEKRVFPAAMAGLLVALTFWEGGLYVCVFAFLLVTSLSLVLSAVRLSLSPIVALLSVVAFSAGFVAIKLIPALEVMKMHPRTPIVAEGNPTSTLLIYLFSRNQDLARAGVSAFGFHEYGAYISLAFVALAICGVLSARRSLPWVVSAYFFLLLAWGDFGTHSIWKLIHQTRGISDMLGQLRLPSRFLVGFVLCVAVVAAAGADLLARRLRRPGQVLGGALMIIGVIDSWLVGPPNLKHIFEREEQKYVRAPFFQQVFTFEIDDMTALNQANMGAVRCYEYTDWTTKALGSNQIGYRGEQYLDGPGSVRATRWSPNALSFEVDTPSPTTLVVNQNFDRGWRIAKGYGEIFSRGGLIGLKLAAGHQNIQVVYRNFSLLIGTIITLVTGCFAVAFWRRERRTT